MGETPISIGLQCTSQAWRRGGGRWRRVLHRSATNHCLGGVFASQGGWAVLLTVLLSLSPVDDRRQCQQSMEW